jgi:hypothetical protein
MLTISMLALGFGAVRLLWAGWRVSDCVPQRNEDMLFF